MSAQVDVLAVMDRQLRDRAERANRYRKNAEKSARKSGEPQITADRMAAYTDIQLVELREARAAVAALIAERDALLAKVEQQPAPVDLEQFREAVEFYATQNGMMADDAMRRGHNRYVVESYEMRERSGKRLLSIIDNAGKVAHQPAPVVDDARMARALEWVRAECGFYNNAEARTHLPAIEEAISAYDPNCGARTVRVVDDAMRELIQRWRKTAEQHGVRTFTGNDHALFANELEAALARAQGVQS